MSVAKAYYQANHNKYRYFDGTKWVGARYDTAEQAEAAYLDMKKKEEIAAKKAKEEEEAKKKQKKPKKVHFLKPPRWWAWVLVALLFFGSLSTLFFVRDNSLVDDSSTHVDFNASVWTDDNDASKQLDKNKKKQEDSKQKKEDTKDTGDSK
jgi:cytoskeletal protein RodZ